MRPLLLLMLGLLAVAAVAGPEWRQAAPGYDWAFPRDHHAHPEYKTEWWYVTGHLRPVDGAPGDWLGFQQTFFRVGLAREAAADTGSAWAATDLVMAHASLADPAAGRHVFSEVLWRAVPLLGGFGPPGDPGLAWCQAPPGTDGRWSLTLEDDAFRLRSRDARRGLDFDLLCRPVKPLVRHGEDGFSPKSADGAAGSLYVSATRMAVTGRVLRQGREVAVTGRAWLDQEIFTSTLTADQTGWDWLSLQLDDGRELMAYRLRTETETDFALGTLVAPDGTSRSLPAAAWSWEPGATWSSPATGAAYPVVWRLRVPAAGLDLELVATMAAQENVSATTGVHYWEGAVEARADGKTLGRGYVELTGYGEGSRPPVR